MPAYAVLTTVTNQPGMLFGLTQVLANHQANVSSVDIIPIPHEDRHASIYFEFTAEDAIEIIVDGSAAGCQALAAWS